ncbi:MAG: DUF1902 domain-containing protein [Rhodanobacter sp.]|nr:MAG: DUF1902 domain-containing protein [Rhodanobacter sp.]TAN25727.1 MAG: DUF1902 domain-containing protein [Rhodanobacter sp.]
MRTRDMILRCYGERDGDLWVTVCVDLSLAAQAETFEAARAKLHAQIQEYVYDALVGEDKIYGSQLLARKSPLGIRAKYYLYASLSSLIQFHRDAVTLFSEVLPMQPASRPC